MARPSRNIRHLHVKKSPIRSSKESHWDAGCLFNIFVCCLPSGRHLVGDVDETKSVLPMTGNEVRIERHFIFHPLPHGIQDALLDPRPTQLMRSVLKSVQVLLIEIQIPCLKMITSNLTSEFGGTSRLVPMTMPGVSSPRSSQDSGSSSVQSGS
jgi:hypothetical protein